MMSKYSYKSKKRKVREGSYVAAFLKMLPVILMAGLVPLVVREYDFQTNLTEYPWFGNETESYDLFLGYKAVLLTLLFFAMAALIFFRRIKDKKRLAFTKILIPLFVYGGFAFLSACFSINRTFAFFGGYEQFESIWVLLSYVLAVYFIFLYADGEQELLVVSDGFCAGVTIISLIGTLQGLKFDIFSTRLVQRLITSKELLDAAGGKLEAKFQNHACATLYNPNYVGVFAALAIPFLAILLLFIKSRIRKIWYFCALVLTVMALLSSHSTGGFLAVGAAGFVALIFCGKAILKRWYLTIPMINLLVAIVLLLNAYNDNQLIDEIVRSLKVQEQSVEEVTAEDGTVIRKAGMTSMETLKDGVRFTYNEVQATVSMYVSDVTYGFYALDENGEQIPLNADEQGQHFYFEEPAFSDIVIEPMFSENEVFFRMTAGREWYFSVPRRENASYKYITNMNKKSDVINAEVCLFEGKESLASRRGFIWGRTIPLLKKYFFIGSGPDTFLLAFPHNDYVNMYRNGYENTLITKPHCMYLQIGVQTGVLSLLAFLTFYVWYALQCFRLYCFRRVTNRVECFGIAAFLGSVGYMVAALANDSMVVTAPMFWVIIGVGAAANCLVKKERG